MNISMAENKAGEQNDVQMIQEESKNQSVPASPSKNRKEG